MTSSSPLQCVHHSSCQSIQNPNHPLTLSAVHRRKKTSPSLRLMFALILYWENIQHSANTLIFHSWFFNSNHKLHFKHSQEHKQTYKLQMNPYSLLTFTTRLPCHNTEDPAKWSCPTSIFLNLNCVSPTSIMWGNIPIPSDFTVKLQM